MLLYELCTHIMRTINAPSLIVFVIPQYKDHYDTRDNTSHHEIVKRQNQQSPTTIKADSTIIKLLHGRDGVQGRDGRDGTPGIKGDRGSKGNQGSKGDQGLNGDKGSKGESKDGRDGRDGAQGIKGDVGPCGDKGDQGLTGPKGEAAGGLIYVRWGHDSCPSNGAQLVYTGRAAGSSHTQKGGGANPQCLPLDPNYLRYRSGAQEYSQMFAAEYHATNGLVASTSGIDVPCAVCYIPTRTALYMIPGKYTCPTGWETEYYGYLTAEYYSFTRSFYTCVDDAMKQVPGSIGFQDGTLFSPVEVKCKSRLCPPYEETKELTCAVCTK